MRVIRIVVALLMVAGAVPALAQVRDSSGNRADQPRPGAAGVIGVRLADVAADQVAALKLPRAEGAVVESVNPNSPASAAGLRAGDVIVEFDGERVRSARQLTRLVGDTPAGREVALGVIREGKKTNLRVKPEAGSWLDPQWGGMIDRDQLRDFGQEIGRQAREMSRNLPDMIDGARAGIAPRGRLGASVQDLSPELAEYFGVKSGVLVASVEKDSPAERAGLKAGDVITAVDGRAVASAADLIRAMPAGTADHDVTLTLVRDKKERTAKAMVPARPRDRAPRRGTPA